MSEEQLYPQYTPMRELPITAAIPYLYRWKILNAKLLLADLETLLTKYQIVAARDLSFIVSHEVNDMCIRMCQELYERRKGRAKLAET